MKKLFLLLMLPLLAATFNACSNDDKDEPNYEQLIVGTWQVTHINDAVWSDETTSYTFNANKTYSTSGYYRHSGTYTVSGNILTIKYVDGEEYTYTAKILSVNGTNATCSSDFWGDGEVVTIRFKKL